MHSNKYKHAWYWFSNSWNSLWNFNNFRAGKKIVCNGYTMVRVKDTGRQAGSEWGIHITRVSIPDFLLELASPIVHASRQKQSIQKCHASLELINESRFIFHASTPSPRCITALDKMSPHSEQTTRARARFSDLCNHRRAWAPVIFILECFHVIFAAVEPFPINQWVAYQGDEATLILHW